MHILRQMKKLEQFEKLLLIRSIIEFVLHSAVDSYLISDERREFNDSHPKAKHINDIVNKKRDKEPTVYVLSSLFQIRGININMEALSRFRNMLVHHPENFEKLYNMTLESESILVSVFDECKKWVYSTEFYTLDGNDIIGGLLNELEELK